eukprot:3637225-Pleurochrysis_carterae.AAC.2
MAVGDECWQQCGRQGGQCAHFCGQQAACCRDGWFALGCPSRGGSCGDEAHCCTTLAPFPPEPAPSVPPPAPPPPLMPVINIGVDCWSQCDGAGPCPGFCGLEGACCRSDWPAAACNPGVGNVEQHTCVVANKSLASRVGFECWYKCGTGGPCPAFCGSGGACCRNGYFALGCPSLFKTPRRRGGSPCGDDAHCCVPSAPLPPPRTPPTSPPPPPPPLTPPPPPSHPPPVLHLLENCWEACGGAGLCPSFCGEQGACCMEDWPAEGCPAKGVSPSDYHACVYRSSRSLARNSNVLESANTRDAVVASALMVSGLLFVLLMLRLAVLACRQKNPGALV